MSSAERSPDTSMDEILASIRRIISDDMNPVGDTNPQFLAGADDLPLPHPPPSNHSSAAGTAGDLAEPAPQQQTDVSDDIALALQGLENGNAMNEQPAGGQAELPQSVRPMVSDAVTDPMTAAGTGAPDRQEPAFQSFTGPVSSLAAAIDDNIAVGQVTYDGDGAPHGELQDDLVELPVAAHHAAPIQNEAEDAANGAAEPLPQMVPPRAADEFDGLVADDMHARADDEPLDLGVLSDVIPADERRISSGMDRETPPEAAGTHIETMEDLIDRSQGPIPPNESASGEHTPPKVDPEQETLATMAADGPEGSEEKQAGTTEPNYAEVSPGRSLEATVTALLRPMLREWLDENMPRLVEAALREDLNEHAAQSPAQSTAQSPSGSQSEAQSLSNGAP